MALQLAAVESGKPIGKSQVDVTNELDSEAKEYRMPFLIARGVNKVATEQHAALTAKCSKILKDDSQIAPLFQAKMKEAIMMENRDSNLGDHHNKLQSLVGHFGASGWANCIAGYVTISALVARGDQINQTIKAGNEKLGAILGEMRQSMLSDGMTQDVLDRLVRNQSTQVRTGDEALQIVNACIVEIAAILNK